jgi:hypothetical protein
MSRDSLPDVFAFSGVGGSVYDMCVRAHSGASKWGRVQSLECIRAYNSKPTKLALSWRPARTCFSELETSKGGSDIIDCLRRSHRAVLSLEASCSNEPTPDRPRIQVGSPYREPGRPSQATKKSRKLASAATLQSQVDTSSRWLPKEDNGASRLSGRVRWRWLSGRVRWRWDD